MYIQFFIALTVVGMATTPSVAQLIDVERNEFGSDYSGRIALIKNAKNKADAKAKYDYNLLPRAGEFSVPVSGRPLWFVVNHTVKKDVEDLEEDEQQSFDPSFIGVQLISYYKPSVRPSTHLYLFRNKNWTRGQDASFNGTSATGKSFSNRAIAEFLAFHDERNQSCVRTDEQVSRDCLRRFDGRFAKWHAMVGSNTENSWDFGGAWWLEGEPQNALMNNYLLRFIPRLFKAGTILQSSSKPVLFSTEISNLSKLRIRTFAPTFEYSPNLFDNDVTLVFE